MTKRELEKEIGQLLIEKEQIKGEKCEVYSRVVGYLRPVEQWNDGKQKEFKQRKTFKIQ